MTRFQTKALSSFFRWFFKEKQRPFQVLNHKEKCESGLHLYIRLVSMIWQIFVILAPMFFLITLDMEIIDQSPFIALMSIWLENKMRGTYVFCIISFVLESIEYTILQDKWSTPRELHYCYRCPEHFRSTSTTSSHEASF